MQYLNSTLLLRAAGLCEVGGGYLIWLWLVERSHFVVGLLGAFLLVVYGIIPTFQVLAFTGHVLTFHRVFAAYGGVFIAISIGWGWLVDKKTPGLFDITGASTRISQVTA